MTLRTIVMVVVVGALAGCLADQTGVVEGEVRGRRLVATTLPASAANETNLANAFRQEGLRYVGGEGAKQDAEGWAERPVVFEVQHPFDLKLTDRWSYDTATDVQDIWVLGSDKAHLPPPNRTTARTELRLIDPEYLPGTGLHKMECDLFIVPGTWACITQVFARGPMAMIGVDAEGTITDLRTRAVIGKGMNGRWFHWTVVHDSGAAGKGAIQIYVDGKLVDGEVSANRSASYYFKVGVYSRHGSERSEVKVRNLRVWWRDVATTMTGNGHG